MVCDKCEDKLSKLIVPDKWTDGARNTTGGKDGGRAVGKDRLEKRRRASRFTPIARSCKICKASVADKMHYCNQCAYKKGLVVRLKSPVIARLVEGDHLSMLARPSARPTTIESLDDEVLAQLEHATPSPWNDATNEAFLPVKPSRPAGSKHAKTATPRHDKGKTTDASLPVIPNNNAHEFIRRAKLSPRHGAILDSTTVAKAYNDLVTQTETMAVTRTTNMHNRYLHEQALRQGIQQLSSEHVQHEKEIIRFNALKNEVDIFQQFLDPFVFTMRTPREHSVHSSVYRHFTRMQGIQDMGIPIYSLGMYTEEPDDKFLTPRTDENFYRRIRRRTAADFIDASLVSRPTPRRPRAPKEG